MTNELWKFANSGKMVCIERDYPSDPRHCGFIQGIGETLLLFSVFHDFYPEGLIVLHISDVRKVTRNDRERLWERILASEGLMDTSTDPPEVSLRDIPSLLYSLAERAHNIIIECESIQSDEDSDFYIGKIISLGEHAVAFLGFDSFGKWDENPSEIPYHSITKVEFDTPYVNIFSKYVTNRNK